MNLKKNFITIFLLGYGLFTFGQAIQVTPDILDFGTVPKWKNDTAFFTVKNNDSKSFVFLPVGYDQDVMVRLPSGYIVPGSTVTVKVIYYTQSRGNFRKSIPVYINTSGIPINLTIKGKIIDFHPDAMLNCPSLIDSPKPTNHESPIEIQVVEAISGQGLTGFDLIVKNQSEQQVIEKSSKSNVFFNFIKNGKYKVVVSLNGYQSVEEDITVNKITRKFVIRLRPDEGPLATIGTESNQNDEPIIIKKEDAEKEEEKKDIDKLREKFRDKYKDKQIIEKDVIVVKEGEKDSLTIEQKEEEAKVSKENVPDFIEGGVLNTAKYADNNIVFLIDVSSSMDRPEKLPYLKKAVKDMVRVLRSEDLVTIIVYSSKVNILLQGEPGSHKDKIYQVIDGLQAKGLSHGSEGLNIAYQNAKSNFIDRGNNQVILVSDGIFSSDNLDKKKLNAEVSRRAKNDQIKTSVIGFGRNAEAITFLKDIAESGSGNFIRILNEDDAATALIAEIMSNSKKE